MKIELEFGNAETLRRQEKELCTALKAVRHAIQVVESEPPFANETFPPELPTPAEQFAKPAPLNGERNPDDVAMRAIESLPSEFTTSEILSAIDDSRFGLSRGTALGAIARLHSKGVFEVIERGAGRRPSRYKKLEAKH